MSIKSQIVVMWLASIYAIDMYGQTSKKVLNRAQDQDLCLEVNDGGTPGDGLCVDGATKRVGVGTAEPEAPLHLFKAASGILSWNADSSLILEGTGNNIIAFGGGTSGFQGLQFGDTDDRDIGFFAYHNNGDYLQFGTNAAEQMRIDSSGNVGIGSSSPREILEVRRNDPSLLIFDDNDISTDLDLGSIYWGGEKTPGLGIHTNAARISAEATTAGNWSSSSGNNFAGSKLHFYVQDNTTTDRTAAGQEKMTLFQNAKLYVKGAVSPSIVASDNTSPTIGWDRPAGASWKMENEGGALKVKGGSAGIANATTEFGRWSTTGAALQVSGTASAKNFAGAQVQNNTTSTLVSYSVAAIGSIRMATNFGSMTLQSLTGGIAGQVLHIFKQDANNTLTINGGGAGTQTINTFNGSSIVFPAGQRGGVTLVCTGSAWWVVGQHGG